MRAAGAIGFTHIGSIGCVGGCCLRVAFIPVKAEAGGKMEPFIPANAHAVLHNGAKIIPMNAGHIRLVNVEETTGINGGSAIVFPCRILAGVRHISLPAKRDGVMDRTSEQIGGC